MSVDKSSDKIRKYTSSIYLFYFKDINEKHTTTIYICFVSVKIYVNQNLNGTKNYGNLETDV